jgi:hypothetical protein
MDPELFQLVFYDKRESGEFIVADIMAFSANVSARGLEEDAGSRNWDRVDLVIEPRYENYQIFTLHTEIPPRARKARYGVTLDGEFTTVEQLAVYAKVQRRLHRQSLKESNRGASQTRELNDEASTRATDPDIPSARQ